MKEHEFLDAVGDVKEEYIEECITYRPEKQMNKFIKCVGGIAAALAIGVTAFFGIPALIGNTTEQNDDFTVRDGVLTSYTGNATDLTIPDNVIKIADGAFLGNKNSSGITTIRLGANLSSVSADSFAGLENLADIIIAENNLSFEQNGGVTMTTDGTVILKYDGDDVEYVIPESVVCIGAHAFQNSALKNVVWNDKLEYIGYNAFAGCGALKAVNLPDSVKLISDGAFSSCVSAVEGSIPENVKISGDPFYAVPFWLSRAAGQPCPLEDVMRGSLTPTEAIKKSDTHALASEINYILASLRGEEWTPDEKAMLANGAISDDRDIPLDALLPEPGISLDKLSYQDNGWGKTGIYDIQIFIPAGNHKLVMEAYAYGTDAALYWSDVIFRIAKAYFVKDEFPENGWNYELVKDGEYSSGIIFKHSDGRIVEHSFGRNDISFVNVIYSPSSTRAAVEYSSYGTGASFSIVSLNGDIFPASQNNYVEYIQRYFGLYHATKLEWIDEDTVKGRNSHGKFTFNVYDAEPVQEPLAIVCDINELNDILCEMGEEWSFPEDKYTITVTGLSSDVIFGMEIGSSVESITAYGTTLEIDSAEVFLYGNRQNSLFEHDGVICFTSSYYAVGSTFYIGKDFSGTIKRDADTSVTLFEENGNLRYRRTNVEMPSIAQTGGLSVAKGYDDFLYSVGEAEFKDGKLILHDPDESYTIGEKYDLDKEFEALYSERLGSIDEVFAYNSMSHLPFFDLLTLSVADIRAIYGELKIEYYENNGASPVCSISALPGVMTIFYNGVSSPDELDPDLAPNVLIITEKFFEDGGTIYGLKIGDRIEDDKGQILWEAAGYDFINGTLSLISEQVDGYHIVAIISADSAAGEAMPDDSSDGDAWSEWYENYLKSPSGEIIGFRVSLMA